MSVKRTVGKVCKPGYIAKKNGKWQTVDTFAETAATFAETVDSTKKATVEPKNKRFKFKRVIKKLRSFSLRGFAVTGLF